MRSARQEQLREILTEAFDPMLHLEMTAEEFADYILAVEPAGMFGSLAALADAHGRPLLSAHELGVVQIRMAQSGL